MKRALVLAALLAGCNDAKPPAIAKTFPGSAEIDRARAFLADGKQATGAEALADALRVVETAGPLRIANLTVAEDARGYGLYTPDSDSTIAPKSTLLLYFEPVGITHGRDGGQWLIDLSADLAVSDAKGAVLQEEREFLTARVASRHANRELHMAMRMTGITLPEGDYLAQITLRDRIGNEQAAEQIPFKVRIP